MRKCRGSSLVEVMTGAGFMMLLTLGTMTMLVAGMQSFSRTSTDVTITQKNAQGVRKMAELMRGAMNATIDTDGTRVLFTMPAMSANTDPITGERELTFPTVSDGVVRGFQVNRAAGTLRDLRTNTVLVRNIATLDLEPTSSQYGQAYTPFVLSSVGSKRVVVMQLVTRERVAGTTRFQRMKNTVLLRNIQ